MTKDQQDLTRERFAWWRSGFDLEGLVGAVAAWVVGLFLGIIWSPLFWVGFAMAVVVLYATRTAERTVPSLADAVVAPCDGTVVSVGIEPPPEELRLADGVWTRVRVSSSPTTSNGVHAPVAGEVDHVIREAGDHSGFLAFEADTNGLEVAYVSMTSGGSNIGFRIATGGLGPRLDIRAEAGEAFRLGRLMGTRRLGGWCDIYLPGELNVQVLPGMTLIGAETVLAKLEGTAAVMTTPDTFEEDAPSPAPDTVPEDVVAAAEAGIVTHDEVSETIAESEDWSPTPETVPQPVETEVEAEIEANIESVEQPVQPPVAELEPEEPVFTSTTPADGSPEDDDPAQMFARLRREASKIQDDNT